MLHFEICYQPVMKSAIGHKALHRARITFLSHEIHSSTCVNRQTIVPQIPAMTLALFSQEWKVT